MGRAFAKFVTLSVFLGMFSSGAAEAVEFGRFDRKNSGHVGSIIEARVDSEICREKTKELKEENKSLNERLSKLEKEVKDHKIKDYHGYGFRDGGWWKNIVSNLQASLALAPLSLLFSGLAACFFKQWVRL